MKLFHLKPLRHQTDEQLMAQAAAGSDAAFEELYRRYARRLKGFFFMQLGGDEELAADATHDVFLRAYEARSRYREGSNVSTWLFTIAYNICEAAIARAATSALGSSPSPTTSARTITAAMPTKQSCWLPSMQNPSPTSK